MKGGKGGGAKGKDRAVRLPNDRPMTMDEVRAEWPPRIVFGAELRYGLIDGLDLEDGKTPSQTGYARYAPYVHCDNRACPGKAQRNGEGSWVPGERVVSGGSQGCSYCGNAWDARAVQRCHDVPRWRLRSDSLVYSLGMEVRWGCLPSGRPQRTTRNSSPTWPADRRMRAGT